MTDRSPIEIQSPRKPRAWLYTLHMEGGQMEDRLSLIRLGYPFGRAGKDYSEEYTVTETPLYDR